MSQRRTMPDNLNKPTINVMDALQGVQTKPMGSHQAETPNGAPASTDVHHDQFQESNSAVNMNDLHQSSGSVSESAADKAIKVKVNLYMNSMIKRRTEKAQDALRDIAPPELTGQVNYSLIVETALKIVLDEFDRQRGESQLSREVMKQLGKGKLKK